MLAISLIFVGITLTANGIILYKGDKNTKMLIILNFFTAFLIFLFNFYQILIETSPNKIIGYLGGLLFGTTNLLVAFNLIYSKSNLTTGIFCGFSFLSAILLSIYYFVNTDVLKGASWLVWSTIWLFSFISFAITSKFEKYTCMMYILQGVVTTFAFGFLQLFEIIKF